MGMLKEGVRLDRVRGGRQKYRRNPSVNPYQFMIPQSTTTVAPTSLEDIKMLETLSISEPEMLSVGVVGMDLMKINCDDNVDDKSRSTSDVRMDTDAHELLSVLSDIYDKELVNVIGWAKQIPGNEEKNIKSHRHATPSIHILCYAKQTHTQLLHDIIYVWLPSQVKFQYSKFRIRNST